MSNRKYYVDNDFVQNFGNLRISNVKQYDKNYFSKAKPVKIYYNKANERPLWVRDPREEDTSPYNLIRIYSQNCKNKQYQKIVKPIRNSSEYDITIDCVYKVVNIYLERQYELKKMKKEEEFGYCKEMKMYHATLPENVDAICTNNFDWRLSGESRGHKYGFGISFSPDPDFVHQFCKSKELKVLFVSKVLISSTHIGSPDLELPKNGYDTTCSPKKTVFVKFEDCEFYPDNIVYYRCV